MSFSLALLSALSLLPTVSACNPSPDPTSGLYVNVEAADVGDGSECFPFLTLVEGIAALEAVPGGKVILISLQKDAEIADTVTVDSAIEVESAGAGMVLSGAIKVEETGRLTITGIRVKQSNAADGPLFQCFGGSLLIEDGEIEGGGRDLIDVFGGSVSFSRTIIADSAGTVIVVRSQNYRIDLYEVTIIDSGNLLEMTEETTGGEGEITMTEVDMRRSGRILMYGDSVAGGARIRVENALVEGAKTAIIEGNIGNLVWEAKNVTVRDSQQIVSGKVTSSIVIFENCTFTNIGSPLFDLSALNGELTISNSTISVVTQGPVILLPANSYPPDSALITVKDSLIENVTNFGGNGLGIVCVGLSVSFSLINSEVRFSELIEGGLFSITAGAALLSNVYYHDCSIIVFSFYESIASIATAKDVVMTRTSSDLVAFTMCIAGTQCAWFNVSITDSTDPNVPRSRSFVLLWSGIFGFSTVRNSYFRNVGRSEPCMAVTESGIIHVFDSTFVELDNNDAFDSMQDGFILFDNVTFVRPSLNMLFWCGMTKTCFQLSRIKIEGEHRVPILLYADGGETSLSDSSFEMISDSVFRVMNGDLVVRNVTVKNQNGAVCRGCMNARITFDSFVLEHSQAPIMFQFAYSTVIFRGVRVSDVVAEKFITLDITTLSVSEGEFTGFVVDSFGGFVSAASSAIYINSTYDSTLWSTLSIRIGLIYLESSSITILNSQFYDFNSTLIYAIQSPVSISNSEFTNGGLFKSDPHKIVLSYGSVLWSEYSPSIFINSSQFYNLSADKGGVFFLIGSGIETCNIQNSIARSNWARREGGFLYASQFHVSITQSIFDHNSAQRGGAVWVSGSSGELYTQISNSRFTNNAAELDGGAIMHMHSRCDIEYCDWINNTAAYGPNFASERSALFVMNNETFSVAANFSIEAVSGQMYRGKILIGTVDERFQIISTDNSSKLSIFTNDENSNILGTTLFDSKQGIFTILNINIVGMPNSNVSIFGTLETNITQQLFTASLRKCIRGEFYDEYQCKLCTHNTYSFDPSESCKLCPPAADCPSGFQMQLHEGYWRSSIYTDEIYQCLIPELCKGGLYSDCAEGHSGVMCSQCDETHFKANQLQCATCKSKGISAFKGLFTLAVSINSLIYALSLSRNNLMIHVVIFDYFHVMRILVNYNIFWPESLSYLYTVAGDIGSVGLTAFTDPCLGAISHITTIYSQLIISLMYFVLFCFCVGASSLLFKWLYRKIKYQVILKFVLYLAYLMLPMIFLRVIQMLPCYSIGDKLYLIYNPSVECWSSQHYAYALGISLPILVIIIAVPFILLIGTLKNSKGIFLRIPKWAFFCFSVFLLRKYALTCILLFSNSLTLPTQVSIVVVFNIATEIAMYQRTDCHKFFFFGLYQSTLISSTFFSLFVGIYWASTSKVTDKETVFILVNYGCLLIPIAYGLSYVVYSRMRKDMRYVVPLNDRSVVDQQETPVVRTGMGDISQGGSFANLNAPSSTPVSH